ncbi:MAG: acyl-CoA/acyl-ACP dehydrogenase, partial [Dehalococcoidia bacterium]|nr:acyl-CoA/acyl-ACP dehydrogenase [Dehalococcoidia bacterium]
MDYGLSEQQEMLKKTSRDFLAAECPKNLVRQMVSDERGYPLELWQKMAQLGWMGLAFPEEYGGSGGSFLDLAVLLEEMGRACLPGPFFSTVIMAGMTILEIGNETQRHELLPQIAEGKLIITLALNEPDGGYDAGKVSVEAAADGDDYFVSGIKLLVPDVHVAGYIICVAKTANGVTLFIVDGRSKGISCTLLKTIAGDKQFEVVFDKVKIPKENILGKEVQGDVQLQEVLRKAAVAKCAEMVGGAQQVLEMTVDYVKERKQFGVPVGTFQAIQHHCANMITDIDTSRFITYQAAWKISQGLPFAKDAAMAKAWVSDAYKRVT